MIIDKIKLFNFRSYQNVTEFNFSPSNNKNIVLIGGENGAGKSTLFEAIKICLYGPNAYGYIGPNSNYLARVKSNINDNAFKQNNINCYIELVLSFKEGTALKQYTLHRSWKYIKQRIQENFTITCDNKELSSDEKLYFDKFLKSIIPPSLFDFFFFDGEELSDFFIGSSANNNLKEAVLTLFNYDTFEVLKKNLLSIQRSNARNNSDLEIAQRDYETLNLEVNKITEELNTLTTRLSDLDTLIEENEIKSAQLDKEFQSGGGLLEEERSKLNSQISQLEFQRLDDNTKIKEFCNDVLPFILVSDLLEDMISQINNEEALLSYQDLNSKLSTAIIRDAINKVIVIHDDVNYDLIANNLINSLYDTSMIENVSPILNLSSSQKNSILYFIENIISNKYKLSKDVLNRYKNISTRTKKIKAIKDRLNSSVSNEVLNTYLENKASLDAELKQLLTQKATTQTKIELLNSSLTSKEKQLVHLYNRYSELLQTNNVLDLSANLISYLNTLLSTLTAEKIRLIEDEFISIFSKVIRKDNYVNSITIDENFNTTLYINKQYTSTEILNIIENVGFDTLTKKYGYKFLQDLYAYYNIDNNTSLRKELLNDMSFNYINLSTKVNVKDFSSGEKQVYILSLIWAIVKTSNVEVPFVIDTPYARIDESHRNNLTNIYLPNLSKQVIILSTNEEIDAKLYQTIKPFICDEYLLLYNSEDRKTEVQKGYFKEVVTDGI